MVCLVGPRAFRVSPQIRELGRAHAVSVQSMDDLARREQRLRLDLVSDHGSQGPWAFLAAQRVHRIVAIAPDLERTFSFVRSEVWFLSPWMAIKRLVTAIASVSGHYAPRVDDDHQFAVRWLLAELVSNFCLQIVVLANGALALPGGEHAAWVADELADPGVDRRRMRQISDAVDRYVAGVLKQVRAPRSVIVNSIGAFAPSPPEYTEALAETARRLSLRVDAARDLPRYVDLVIHERLVRNREPTTALVDRLNTVDVDVMARAARLVAAFLIGQAGLTASIGNMLGESVTQDSKPAAATERSVGAENASAGMSEVRDPDNPSTLWPESQRDATACHNGDLVSQGLPLTEAAGPSTGAGSSHSTDHAPLQDTTATRSTPRPSDQVP